MTGRHRTEDTSDRAGSLGRIKGAALVEFMRFVRRDFGDDLVRSFLTALPAAHRPMFDLDRPSLGILPSTWYPAEPIHMLLDRLCEGRSVAQRHELAIAASEATLAATMNGVHRAIMRMIATPKLHARFSQVLWNAYFDNGVVEAEVIDATTHRYSKRDWSSHHPLLCDMIGFASLPLFRMMGCRKVEVIPGKCVATGAPACTHMVRWAGS